MLIVLGLLLCLPQVVLAWFFVRARGGPRWIGEWLRSAGWLVLWVLPAVVAQAVFNGAGMSSSSFAIADLFAMLPWSWSVLLGGATVQAVFEETAKALSGHRQSTMMDNFPWYLALTWVQLALVSLFCALRRPKAKSFADRVSITFGMLVLINALCGIAWPWWGS